MIYDNKVYAPHFGVWNLVERYLPKMGEVVLGMACAKKGGPQIFLCEWRIVEEPSDYNPDHLFAVGDRDSGEEVGIADLHMAAWFLSFYETESSGQLTVANVLLWAETRFLIQTPLSVCEECDALHCDLGGCDEEDEE